MTANNKTKEIAVGEDFGNVAVSANGVHVEIRADGEVKVRPIANDDKGPAAGKPDQIGRHIEGKGVFLGRWAPKDSDGISLNKIFNLFAAPDDLTDKNGQKLVTTYNKAVERISELNDWHGHDGGAYKNDTELYDALRDGTYNGEWFIPTRDILHGKDVYGNNAQADHLYGHNVQTDHLYGHIYGHKDESALAGTFTNQSGSGYALWYWSCSEVRDDRSFVWIVRLADGDDYWDGKRNYELSTRPVRAELRP